MMIDLVRKSFLLGLGLMAATKEKSEQLVDELVQEGKMEKTEATKMVKEMIEKGQQQREMILDAVRKETDKLRKDLGVITKQDLAAMEEKLRVLEERLKTIEEKEINNEIV